MGLVENQTMLAVLRKIELIQVKKIDKVRIKTSLIQPRKLKRWVVQEKAVIMKVKWYNILLKTKTMLLILLKTKTMLLILVIKTKTMQVILVETKTMLVLRKIELKLWHVQEKDVVMKMKTS